MAGTHIDCYVSNGAHVALIPNVSKSEYAQLDYRMMAYVIKTSVDQIKMAATSGEEYVSLAFVAPEFSPRKLYADLANKWHDRCQFPRPDLDADRLSHNETWLRFSPMRGQRKAGPKACQ
jgi:uncharacterized protein (DUF736 family)